jgi:hypothetical protein
MIDIDTLRNTIAFLNRAQISGAEVPAWVAVFNALNAEMQRLQAPPTSQ